MLVVEIHGELAPVRVQRKVGEGHDDVPVLLTPALQDPAPQGGQVLGPGSEGRTDHVDVELPPVARPFGEPFGKFPGHAVGDLRRRVRIPEKGYGGDGLGRHPYHWPLCMGWPGAFRTHHVPGG